MDELRSKLFYEQKNGYDLIDTDERIAVEDYCGQYMSYLNDSRTEREAVKNAIALAEEQGFVEYELGMELRPGMRIYRNNRGKALMLAVIGKKSLAEGAVIAGAHVDSPRLDLKQITMYETDELCYFKTHYYGGIKKYQWTTVPLALHGVVAKADGTVITVNIGEDEADPIFYITDLLPHLAADQMKKTLSDGVTAEQLNAVFASILDSEEGADRVKFAALKLLAEKYGMTEEDFISSELTLVPALRAREVGLDRSLIAAYGHDDRVCAYAEFEPLLRIGTPEYTSVCILADKEEIGSEGVSGMQCQSFETFMEDLCEGQGVSLRRCFEASVCLSADVTAALDPTFPEVSEKHNTSRVNYGIALCKYTGSRGKGGASDASAELVARVRAIFDGGEVFWQMCELGKVDQGGGGTVAAYMARRNIDTLDAGVPVLSMHAPYELVSKLDCYMTMKGMKAFYLAD